MRRKRVRTDPKTGRQVARRTSYKIKNRDGDHIGYRPRRGTGAVSCRCGFVQKSKKGLLVWCGICKTGHHTV